MQVPLSPLETAPSRSIYEIPSVAVTRVVETDESDATLYNGAESGNPVVKDDRKENNTENGDSVKEAAASPSTTTVQDIEHIKEPRTPDEPQHSLKQVGISDRETDVPLSRRIHILGFTAHARFIAHAVASTPDVPVRIFAHHRRVLRHWGEENRSLSLYDGKGRYVSSIAIPCPERIPYPAQYLQGVNSNDYFLDNIIVDTTTTAILPSLDALRDRIDHRTTICLLHPGLGLMENLNESIFTDPIQRPNFVLGHSTHRVAKGSRGLYSMRQMQPGVLYLHGVPRSEGETLYDSFVAQEAMRQSQHLAELLSSTESLNVVGLPWVRFLSWKLPRLIFSSAADTISVALGCKYKDIYPNPHARVLWDKLLDETIAIVSQFPELQEVPHRIQSFTGKGFRRKLRTSLFGQRNNTSPWVKQVRLGQSPPVDYFNGYIVQRAKELGLEHKYNTMASEMVKARLRARRQELHNDLLGTTPYMTDTDFIGGGQPAPSLEDMLELELEDL
ncbi:hypothetical protein F4782DRAFT_523141 [Xylaria castorea]|nr:hypothetical protein F4782DRAFT_523141 [Xylaria castorea]